MSRAAAALGILGAFEDRAFEDVVAPLIRRVAAEEERQVDLVVGLTHGCRFGALERLLRDHPNRWWVIGADARREAPTRKMRTMRERLRGLSIESALFAVPQPSAEGWLQADLGALRRGIAEALGREFRLPARAGRYPRDEQRAKSRLRELLHVAGVPMLRGGLEFGPYVMREVSYDAHPSLARFVEELRLCLRTR